LSLGANAVLEANAARGAVAAIVANFVNFTKLLRGQCGLNSNSAEKQQSKHQQKHFFFNIVVLVV